MSGALIGLGPLKALVQHSSMVPRGYEGALIGPHYAYWRAPFKTRASKRLHMSETLGKEVAYVRNTWQIVPILHQGDSFLNMLTFFAISFNQTGFGLYYTFLIDL